MTTTLAELTGSFVFDAASTRIGFVAKHTMATRVRGHFDVFEGSAHLDGDDPSQSTAELTIQADSIQTRNPGRDAQLSDDFLGAAQHPTLTFSTTRVRQAGPTTFAVTGDLTIRGVSKPVTVDVELTGTDPRRVTFTGSVTVNRMDWGVNWNAATTLLVSPKVTLEFEIAAIRQS